MKTARQDIPPWPHQHLSFWPHNLLPDWLHLTLYMTLNKCYCFGICSTGFHCAHAKFAWNEIVFSIIEIIAIWQSESHAKFEWFSMNEVRSQKVLANRNPPLVQKFEFFLIIFCFWDVVFKQYCCPFLTLWYIQYYVVFLFEAVVVSGFSPDIFEAVVENALNCHIVHIFL